MYPHTLIPTPFFANFLLCFILLLMNSNTSGLENDYSLAKNILSFKEVVGARFSSFFWFHFLYFGFTYSIGDALILLLEQLVANAKFIWHLTHLMKVIFLCLVC